MQLLDSIRGARRVPDWRWPRDLREWWSRPAWPRAGSPAGDRVAVVCANYNTCELVSRLIFSLHRVLPRGAVEPIVVVDNASTDGSRSVLAELYDAGLIELIANERQRYHGPALNQAIASLAGRPVDYVWVLDSDVVVLRADVVVDAVAAMRAGGAALLGEHDGPKVALNSVLLDPAQVWNRAYPPFLDHGDPSIALQRVLGDRVARFPFRHGTYVLHLGRGTLSAVARAGEREHPQFAWAVEHQERTYGSHPFGARLHEAFLARYADELAGRTLAEACADPERIAFPAARALPPLEEVARRFADGTLDELYDGV